MNRRNFVASAALSVGLTGMSTASAQAPRRAARSITAGAARLTVVEAAHGHGAGVLLQPTIAGINPYMRRVAAELAGRGYTVAIWDPYDGETPPGETLGQLERSRRITDEHAMGGLRSALDYMTGPLQLRSVATIGWCLGGRFALLQGGLDQRLAAVVAYYPTIYSPARVMVRGAPLGKADFPGQTLDEFPLVRRIACPVQIHRPGHDLAQPAEHARLQEALYARAAATAIHYYPEAAHGFSYELDKPGNAPAAALSWPGTLALLEATIGQRAA